VVSLVKLELLHFNEIEEEITTISKDAKTLGKFVQIDEARIQNHLGELVRGTAEETLNSLLEAEADAQCGAQRYERSPERVDTRAGSYQRKLHTKAGEVKLDMPKLRRQTFETAIIKRYRRRETSIYVSGQHSTQAQ
jgi:putative transposase